MSTALVTPAKDNLLNFDKCGRPPNPISRLFSYSAYQSAKIGWGVIPGNVHGRGYTYNPLYQSWKVVVGAPMP